MNDQILAALDAEISLLKQARHILTGNSAGHIKTPTSTTAPTRKKRRISAKGRKAMAAAQRARWAKFRAAKEKGQKKTT